ncbi:hypothetical protein HPB52_009148 [Rhipicephalus sanguineus]|uniref:Cystatin domain-containing protein n=1 Tax=Rhipicephalus sanguineus TaxID=34632 RepID=A0A9D4QA96_RHISA|nr:hypothetical protein HPB52_009148 [Rhipicephalus sanguineus]
MASLRIATCGFAVLIAICQFGAAQPGLPGGWHRHSVGDNTLFEELAHFAISRQVGDREYFDTVLELVDVESQVVAGTNYRIKFKVGESTCRVTENTPKRLVFHNPGSAEEQIPVLGGWQKHNVSDDAIYEELAHFAVSKQVENREFFDTVLEIVDVESQKVAGTNYRIKFKITESNCPITAAYNKATCLPKSREGI